MWFRTVLISLLYFSTLRRDESSESSDDGSETAATVLGEAGKKTTMSKTASIAIQTCNQSKFNSDAISTEVGINIDNFPVINLQSDVNQLETPGHNNHKSAEQNKNDVDRKKELQKITEELYNEMVADDFNNPEQVRYNVHRKIAKSIRKTKDMVSQDLNQNVITSKKVCSKTKEVSLLSLVLFLSLNNSPLVLTNARA